MDRNDSIYCYVRGEETTVSATASVSEGVRVYFEAYERPGFAVHFTPEGARALAGELIKHADALENQP